MLWSPPCGSSNPDADSYLRYNVLLVSYDGFRYNGSNMVDTLTPAELADLLTTQELDLVDVRDHQDWVAGHIGGTRSVPLDDLRADPDVALPHRDRAIVFVCAKGIRSMTAAKLAERLGYEKLYSLDGGTNAWVKAGLPTLTEHRVAA
jgi:rhodanese-related sulfurtransferase